MHRNRTRTPLLWIAVVALASCAGTKAVDGEPIDNPAPRDTSATRLTVAPPYFDESRIVSTRSLPPQFKFGATRDMPTPGYEFRVEAIDLLAAEGRIVAKVIEVKPSGMVAQMISPTSLQLDLGELPRGRYLLELWLRRAGMEPQLAQTWVLTAN